MRLLPLLLAASIALASPSLANPAETGSEPPTTSACGGFYPSGSADTMVESRPGARLGDMGCVVAIGGSSNVFVNGRPALRVGDSVRCPDGRTGTIVGGASSVFVNGRPAATAGSLVQGCEPRPPT